MAADGMAAFDRNRMHSAANILLTARRTLHPIHDLPADLRPASLEEAYFLQDVMAEALGRVGGWKVGAGSPSASPLYGPMSSYTIAPSGTLIANKLRRMRGLEAEIAFLIGKDLPPRKSPYSREEVTAAVASCHPAIELLESALWDPDAAERLTMVGDLQMHGGFIYGNAIANWPRLDLAGARAALSVDGVVRVENGQNPGGSDVLRLVVWLANEGQKRTGGLKAGQWITTGSWTGKTLASEGSEAEARFAGAGEGIGPVTVRFE